MDQEITNSEAFLKGLPTAGGFLVPDGYFDSLNQQLLMQSEEAEFLVGDEISSGNFSVPDGYFESLNQRILDQTSQRKARRIPLYRKPLVMWMYGVAAAALLVMGLFFIEPNTPKLSDRNSKINVEDIADQLNMVDLNEDMLCDAGWCNELETVVNETDETTEDVLNESDVDWIIEEL